MAHTEPLPATALNSIARQIGERRSLTGPMFAAVAPGAALSIAESFKVWMLGVDALQQPPGRLATLARETGTWHHQINHGAQAREFARSVAAAVPPGAVATGDMQLVELTPSPMAGRIGETIEWIDKNASGDPLARLLIVPAYYLVAFWLEQPNRDEIVVVDRPAQFESVHYFQIYEYPAFRDLLLGLPRPQGLPTTPPPPG